MAAQTIPEPDVATTDKKPSTRYVYFFGGGKADGNGKMKDELGGKGAGLAEMTNAGLPVPPGFTIQTEACREYMRRASVSPEVDRQMEEALVRLEQLQGQKLGQGENPLLVSARTGQRSQCAGQGVWQPRRHQRHRRRFHAQSCYRQQRVLWRVPDERAGRRRCRWHPYAGTNR